jgi:hypothetical protein
VVWNCVFCIVNILRCQIQDFGDQTVLRS